MGSDEKSRPVNGSGDPIRVVTKAFRSERIRVFVLTEGSGKPVSGVPVSVVAELASSNENETRHIPVAMLQSDRVGYLSLKVGRLAQNPELRHLWLRPFNDQRLEVDAFPLLVAGAEPALATIALPPERANICQKTPHLPSVPDPDATDWHISPESFGTRPEITIGEGPCEEFLHSREVEGSFRFHQLVRDGGDPQVLIQAPPAPCESQDGFLSLPQRCYRLGAMLEYEISWEPIVHGLGRVVYSLPLAPCESVRIAVIDWRRQDEVSRDEDTSIEETLHHSQRRDRDIEESVRATLTERQIGGSFMGGFGASGSKGGRSSSFGGTGSMGGAVTGSRGSRRLAAETAQHIADEVSQSTTALRRLNSTIVVQASQAEQEVLQTRTVANHNHCHALTVLYYEVVRHYRVRVRLVHKQDVIFVQYRSINDMQEPFHAPPVGEPGHIDNYVQRFSPRVVLRYRGVLKPILLDPLLLPCFEAVGKLYCAERAFLQTPPDIPAEDYDLESIEIRFTTGEVAADEPIFVSIRPVRGEQEILLLPPDDYYNPGGPSNRLNMGRDFTANSEVILTLRPARRGPGGSTIPHRVRWRNIDSMKLETDGAWGLTEVVARTQHVEHHWTMVERTGATDPIAHDFESESTLFLEVTPWGPRTPEETLTPVERCCVDGLIEHLNLNNTFYSRAIWINQDAEERARAFERYAFEVEDEEGSRLTDFIENRVVGVTGDYVAFPMTVNRFADELVEEGEVMSERIVTLPTRGLFAETKLSHCSACEERDVTRYWDWTESPCPEPPEIVPVEAGSRAEDIVPEATPTTFPSPVVNIVNPPSAPDPTGLAAALTLLGKSDIFRDMSAAEEVGALVRDLAKGSVTLAQAQERAQNIERNREGSRGAGTDGAAGQTRPRELHDRGTVINRAIDTGVRDGSLSSEDASDLRRRMLEEMISTVGGGGGSVVRYAEYSEPPADSLTHYEDLLRLTAMSLQEAASLVTLNDVVQVLRGAEGWPGIYETYNIPDRIIERGHLHWPGLRETRRSDGRSVMSWRSWLVGAGDAATDEDVRIILEQVIRAGRAPEGSGADDIPVGVGGGWFIDSSTFTNGAGRLHTNPPRYIDFWRWPVTPEAQLGEPDAPTPLVWHIIARLADDLGFARSVVEQLGRLMLLGPDVDSALTLVRAYREFGRSTFQENGIVDSGRGGGLDYLATEMPTMRGTYIRDDFRMHAAPPGLSERGGAAQPGYIQRGTILEATGALLNYRRDEFFAPRALADGLAPEGLDRVGRRIWITLFFAELAQSTQLIHDLRDSGADLGSIVGNRNLQRFDIVKAAHVSAGEAQVLDDLVLTPAFQIVEPAAIPIHEA